jgi:hypothetical protein
MCQSFRSAAHTQPKHAQRVHIEHGTQVCSSCCGSYVPAGLLQCSAVEVSTAAFLPFEHRSEVHSSKHHRHQQEAAMHLLLLLLLCSTACSWCSWCNIGCLTVCT